jgi:serine/threonine protein kinase
MKDLLRKMLHKDPQLRLSAEDLLAHEFFKSSKSFEMENEMEI